MYVGVLLLRPRFLYIGEDVSHGHAWQSFVPIKALSFSVIWPRNFTPATFLKVNRDHGLAHACLYMSYSRPVYIVARKIEMCVRWLPPSKTNKRTRFHLWLTSSITLYFSGTIWALDHHSCDVHTHQIPKRRPSLTLIFADCLLMFQHRAQPSDARKCFSHCCGRNYADKAVAEGITGGYNKKTGNASRPLNRSRCGGPCCSCWLISCSASNNPCKDLNSSPQTRTKIGLTISIILHRRWLHKDASTASVTAITL